MLIEQTSDALIASPDRQRLRAMLPDGRHYRQRRARADDGYSELKHACRKFAE
jgi:hypothetical protein